MTNSTTSGPTSDPLGSIWSQQRNSILGIGEQLWSRLPPGHPAITIHGRDLKPETEGVGFQFQLTANGSFYQGRVQAAYYVVQVSLTRGRTSLAWLIETMPVLEIANGSYDLYRKREHTHQFRDRPGIESLFLQELVADAGHFFGCVRADEPIDEPAVPHGGGRADPVL